LITRIENSDGCRWPPSLFCIGQERALLLKISQGIGKAIGKMCNLERSTSAGYLEQFFIR
jgi:hypothetical protein